jgi:hypothetical protein
MAFWIIDKLIIAYILSVSLFFILSFCIKAHRRRTKLFLNKANLIIVLVLLVNIIFVGEEVASCISSNSKPVPTVIEDAYKFYQKDCTALFIPTFLFAFVFQLLFFFNKYRISVAFTVVSIVLLTFFCNYEKVVIYITSIYRDYLPSSWSIYHDSWSNIWSILFTAIYFSFCWINKTSSK